MDDNAVAYGSLTYERTGIDGKGLQKSAFYGFSDEKKTKLFFEVLGHLTELLAPEDVYEFLHNAYEVPDTDIHHYGLMGEEHLLGEGIPIGVPKERTPLWSVMRRINFEKDIVLTHKNAIASHLPGAYVPWEMQGRRNMPLCWKRLL